MESTALAIEFVAFCLQRRPTRWPEIYDEMCYVAARRLFRGLGYEDLARAGFSLDLTRFSQLRRLVEEVRAHTGT